MNETLKTLVPWLPTLLFAIPLIISSIAMHSFGREVDGNEKFDTPEQHQVYWHVVHNRQDIKAIYFMVLFGFVIVITLLWLIANKLHVFD